jgi:ribosomal protein S18 acetylase RimI-like enzyme
MALLELKACSDCIVAEVRTRNPFLSGLALRPARDDDYAFALALYLSSTLPLLSALGNFDEVDVRARFAVAFKREASQVICLDGLGIGWMQVSETIDRFHLNQIHLMERWRSHGIGGHLIEQLLEHGRQIEKAVALNVIRGNSAITLYRRLGFRIIGGDKKKLHLRWDPRSVLK